MKAFADLYAALDQTTKTTAKVEAMTAYFARVAPAEAAWAVYFLSGRKPRQVVPVRKLTGWAIELAGIPGWLFEESYHAVGDIAETIALLLPGGEGKKPHPPGPPLRSGEGGEKISTALLPLSEAERGRGGEVLRADLPLNYWVEEKLLPLRAMDEAAQKAAVLAAWAAMDRGQAFVWNKLITGGFRVGVSQSLVLRALANVGGIDPAVVAHRLMGEWQPTAEFFAGLIAAESSATDAGKPYPFYLAHPLEKGPESLGDVADWQVEWKWDGIRSQLIRRSGRTFLWSRGEELVTERYPELAAAGDWLPDGTVIDGEILPWKGGAVLPFAQLQRRIGRKTVGKKLLDEVPVVLMAYDLIETAGRDNRDTPLSQRRAELAAVVAALGSDHLTLSPAVEGGSWAELAAVREGSRGRQVEGFMLKRKASPYRVGRVRGDWWKWKIDPLTVDAVLTTAQRGSGKRASLYTDYTFAVWDGDALVPIAKAYSGLTDAEIREVDAFIRKNTLDKFGPIRTVKPELVFELGFEGIQASPRHKSGIAVRFPRILRRRTDKTPRDADTLDRVKALLAGGGA